MPWTTPKTWAAGEIPGATEFNQQIRDNLSYLLQRPFVGKAVSTGGSYTVGGGTWSNVDATNLAIAITPVTGRLMFGINCTASAATSGVFGLRVNIDAGASYQHFFNDVNILGQLTFSPASFFGGLTAGVQHTLVLQARSTVAVTLHKTYDNPIHFWAMEY